MEFVVKVKLSQTGISKLSLMKLKLAWLKTTLVTNSLSLKHAAFAASDNTSFLLCSFFLLMRSDLWLLLANESANVS